MSESAEPPARWPVRFLDGIHPVSRDATALIADGRLELARADAETAFWPLTLVRLLEAPQGELPGVLCPDPASPARIHFADPAFAAALRAALPRQGWWSQVDKPAARRLTLWLGSAVAGILFVLFVAIPLAADRLVALVPEAYERKFGAEVVDAVAGAMAKDRRNPFCEDATPPLLMEITSRLEDAATLRHPLTVRLLDSTDVNAFTAPGGQIVVLRGLLDFARTPDELIGVLAHEVAHAERQDPMRGMIRSVATGAVLGLVFGDAIFFSTASAVLTLYIGIKYSREVETATDARAFELMSRIGASPAGLGTFFERLDRREKERSSGLAAHLSTHPASAERAAAAALAPQARQSWKIEPARWRQLKAACG